MINQMRNEGLGSFGDWLRRRRKALDLTQADLAQRAGCSAATIRKLEADERKPSQQLAELLAVTLLVPEDELWTFVQVARQVRAVAHLSTENRTPVAVPPAQEFPHNFLTPMTSVVERVRDATNVARLLTQPDVRLLTLLGPPGIGKTRLCIHVARSVAGNFQDGVWFVDLAPITDAWLVLPTIAHVLSVAEEGVMPLPERMRATLAEKQLLLVLDNFEQVIAAATEIAELLHACKGLKVLATSRVPLHLAGEHEYAVPPLSVPPPNLEADVAPDNLMSYEAVQLFVARVRQHQHDFAISPVTAAPIISICIRLDGIPLALELAAAALRHMTLHQFVAMLHDDANWLHALRSPARDLPPRHRTLYQAIAWSYSLLEPSVQTIFRQLSIFVGGFTEAAAHAVCAADRTTLVLLTDHNLLARAPERWWMLEMIREFALAHMSSVEQTTVRQRLIAYFVTQAATNPVTNLEAIARDRDNFRTALLWAIDAHDTHAALTLCLNLSWFWETHGYLREGMALARSALAISESVDTPLRMDVLERVSTLAWQAHQFDLALHYVEQITTLAHSHGRPEELAIVFNTLGRIYIEQGDYVRAKVALQESMQFAREVPHLFNPGCPLAQLGELALTRGDRETAQTLLARAVTQLAGDEKGLFVPIHVAIAHTNLAEVALAHGNPVQARHELRQGLPYALSYMRRLHCLFVTLAGLLLAEDAQVSARLLGAVAGGCERTGASLSPMHQALIAQRGDYAQGLLTQSEWQAAWQVGHSWTLAQAVQEAEKWLAMDSSV